MCIKKIFFIGRLHCTSNIFAHQALLFIILTGENLCDEFQPLSRCQKNIVNIFWRHSNQM